MLQVYTLAHKERDWRKNVPAKINKDSQPTPVEASTVVHTLVFFFFFLSFLLKKIIYYRDIFKIHT